MRKCKHPRINWTVQEARCHYCGRSTSIGPSNEDGTPDIEIASARRARSDRYWTRREQDGFAWDVTRPLAEQWPWSDTVDESEACRAHQAAGNKQIEALLNEEYAPIIQGIKDSHADAVPPAGWSDRVLAETDRDAKLDAYWAERGVEPSTVDAKFDPDGDL